MRKRAADVEKAEELEVKKAQEFKKNFESTRQKRTDVSFFFCFAMKGL